MIITSSLAADNVIFPEEILIEIFSYVEAKYLLRCKSVCKLWYAVIRSKQLVEMHLMRNGHRHYDMHITDESLDSDEAIDKSNYKCRCCRGLLLEMLFAASSAVDYRIYNPATNCTIDLPHPHKGVMFMHIFLNTHTGSYNVFSVCFDQEKKMNDLELLDLGGQSNDTRANTDLSWRILNISEFDKVSRLKRYLSSYIMSTEGILYILHTPYIGSSKLKLTCVDIVKLACTTIDVPLNLCLNWIQIHFQLWRGKPSIVFMLEEQLYVLVLEDFKNQKWADTIVFPLPSSNMYPHMKIFMPCIYTDETEDVLACDMDKYSSQVCVYKLKSKVVCRISSLPWKVPATLVSVKGMQPEKKEPRIKLLVANG